MKCFWPVCDSLKTWQIWSLSLVWNESTGVLLICSTLPIPVEQQRLCLVLTTYWIADSSQTDDNKLRPVYHRHFYLPLRTFFCCFLTRNKNCKITYVVAAKKIRQVGRQVGENKMESNEFWNCVLGSVFIIFKWCCTRPNNLSLNGLVYFRTFLYESCPRSWTVITRCAITRNLQRLPSNLNINYGQQKERLLWQNKYYRKRTDLN